MYAPHLRWPERRADGAHGSRRGVALRAATYAVPTASAHLEGALTPALLSLFASCAGIVTDHQRSQSLCAGPPAHYIGSWQGEGIKNARQPLCVCVCVCMYACMHVCVYV